MIVSGALLEWLRARLDAVKSPVIKAVYAGLIARIERGDFDA